MYLGNLFSVISDKLTIIFRQIKINEIILARQPFCTDLHVCSFIYIIHNIECTCSSMFVGSSIKHHQISPYLGFQHLNFYQTSVIHGQESLPSIAQEYLGRQSLDAQYFYRSDHADCRKKCFCPL